MASIKRRRGKYHVVYYYLNEDGEKKQKWESFDTEAEAKHRKAEIEYKQGSRTFIAPSKTTVAAFLEDFVSLYGTKKWSPSTYEANTGLIRNYINPKLGSTLMQDVTSIAADRFISALQRTKCPTYKNRYYYCNRDTVDGTWYTSTPDDYQNDCRIRKDVIIEIISDGQVIALDGNGDFEGKKPFIPFYTFREQLAQAFLNKHPGVHSYEDMKQKLLFLPSGEPYSDPSSCQDNWIFALDFGNETEQVLESADWMGREYHILAVQYTHKPTGFVFTNYRFRAAVLQPNASSHDLLLYDWHEDR